MLGRTIAAISTPYGRGGVALIRVSGDEAIDICEKVFFPKNGKRLSEQKTRYAVYGDIISNGSILDDAVATCYTAPASYTGENTVEICCHGGIRLSCAVLEAILAAGAYSAQAGEFTRRAFINGKLALTEAEAVMNLIDAATDEQIKLASSHRRGVLSRAADDIYKKILALLSSTYAYIDYPDEDLTDVSVAELEARLNDILCELRELEASYKIGRVVSEGIKTAIVGRPNAGKSSLLNLIVGEERAIVTDIAGTTRDVIEENVKLDRVVLRIADTAGIRETKDKVEKIGVERAYKSIRDSELVYAVFDGSKELEHDDRELISYIKNECAGKKVIAVINKSDIGQNDSAIKEIKENFDDIVTVSTKTGDGKKELFEMSEHFFISGEIDYDAVATIANSRQHSAVLKAINDIEHALCALGSGFTQDVAGMDLEAALADIGELDSRSVGEDIVNDIFARFCVGK